MQRIGSIVRLQRVHLDISCIDVESIGQTGRKVLEDLVCRATGRNHEWIVQTIGETNLNQSSVVGSRRHATWRLNDTRHR